MAARATLLATLTTKEAEASFLRAAMVQLGVSVKLVDISLHAGASTLDGDEKKRRMAEVAAHIGHDLAGKRAEEIGVVVGIGGGTGGEIVLQVFDALPALHPKILITPLPFDPRPALADKVFIIVPTLVDILGLNDLLRQALEAAAAVVAGVCNQPVPAPQLAEPMIGLTALGATGVAVASIEAGLRDRGEACAVFHANGFGGAGFARFAEEGAFKAVVDLTCHELNRLLFAGDHVSMKNRFTAAADLPQIVLPGGLNFLGLGPVDTLEPAHSARPHYQHSKQFTHVKVLPEEMAEACEILAGHLNDANSPVHVIVPMGGFSHRDCPSGEIEDEALRILCFEMLVARARHYEVESIPHHINEPPTAQRVLELLKPYL